MTPQDLSTKIEGLIISANERYAASILRVQDELYESLVTALRGIEVDSDGFIKQTSANRKILSKAQAEFDTVISGSVYQNSLGNYLRSIPLIDELNADYFATISSAFKPNRIFIRQLQTQVIESINVSLLNDGLIAQVKQPLADILNQNINSGGSFAGMLEQVRTYVKGTPDLDGRLMSYSRGILRDTLFQYSRAFQQSVTSDLGLEWYLYSGGLVKDSRNFCIERAGNFYHKNEIMEWASLNWKGKNNQTTKSSIFILCGGYSCTHFLIPVSDSIVPKDVLNKK